MQGQSAVPQRAVSPQEAGSASPGGDQSAVSGIGAGGSFAAAEVQSADAAGGDQDAQDAVSGTAAQAVSPRADTEGRRGLWLVLILVSLLGFGGVMIYGIRRKD